METVAGEKETKLEKGGNSSKKKTIADEKERIAREKRTIARERNKI